MPNDQKNKVNPFVNPKKSAYGPCILGIFMHKIEPAKVVMASAPIFIQYGGTNASGDILKNTSLYMISVIKTM